MGSVVIVEGTCGSGKSTLVRALGERIASAVVVGARETYGPIVPLEDAGTIDDERSRAHLLAVTDRILDAAAASEVVVVNTLHITQRLRPGVLSARSFADVDALLASVDALVALLVIDEAAIRQRAVRDRRGTDFERYARKLGRTEDERVRYFAGEQEAMRRVLEEESQLRSLALSGERPAGELAEEIERALR